MMDIKTAAFELLVVKGELTSSDLASKFTNAGSIRGQRNSALGVLKELERDGVCTSRILRRGYRRHRVFTLRAS